MRIDQIWKVLRAFGTAAVAVWFLIAGTVLILIWLLEVEGDGWVVLLLGILFAGGGLAAGWLAVRRFREKP